MKVKKEVETISDDGDVFVKVSDLVEMLEEGADKGLSVSTQSLIDALKKLKA